MSVKRAELQYQTEVNKQRMCSVNATRMPMEREWNAKRMEKILHSNLKLCYNVFHIIGMLSGTCSLGSDSLC